MIPEIPLWVGFAQAAGFAVWSFVVALVGTRCALRLAIGPKPEGTPGEHWTASARRLWPARRNVATAMFFFPVFAAGSVLTIGARIVLPLYFVAGAAFVAAVAGAQIAGNRFRRLHDPAPPAGARAQLVGMVSLSLVLYILVYVALLFAALMPSGFSAAGVVWAAALAALTHGVTRGIGLRLAVLCRVASRAPRSLEARVDALAAAIGHAPVPVYVIRTPMLNAFALPRLPAVAVTDALLRHMTPAEVDGILAHELGHITEGRAVQNVRVLLAWIPFVVLTTVYVMRSLSVDPTVQVGSLFVLVFLHLKLSGTFLRKQEARADAVAHGHQHEDGVYARALEKIYRLNAVPAVLAGRGKSHPHLYDRMVAAGVTPDYPRPEPPSQRRASLASAVVLVVAVVGFVVGVIFSQTLLAPPISDSRSGEAH